MSWDAPYSRSRRKHAHRCFRCRRIVHEGEDVRWYRVRSRTTRVLHRACVDQPSNDGLTSGELLTLHEQARTT